MVRFRVIAAVVALAMLAQVPVTALAAAGKAAQVATSATSLTAQEMARYSLLQADAQRQGVLSAEKGGASEKVWIVLGVVVGAVIAISVFAMINDAS
jgi:hypothetical protein